MICFPILFTTPTRPRNTLKMGAFHTFGIDRIFCCYFFTGLDFQGYSISKVGIIYIYKLFYFFNFFFFEVSGIHSLYKGKILRLLQEIFLTTELGEAIIREKDMLLYGTTLKGDVMYETIYRKMHWASWSIPMGKRRLDR